MTIHAFYAIIVLMSAMHSVPDRKDERTRRIRRLVSLSWLPLLAGCVERDVNGATTTFRFAPWAGAMVLAVAVAFFPAGWFLRGRSKIYGYALMLLSPVGLLWIGPSLLVERVMVAPAQFSWSGGMWWSAKRSLRFDQLQRIEVGGGKRVVLRWVTKDGAHDEDAVSDLMAEALPDILAGARTAGVSTRPSN